MMTDVVHSALGIDPSSRVVGSSVSNGTLLLRARSINGTTQRYVACYNSDGSFKYFRRVTSSERKRLGRGQQLSHPLETLNWSQGSTCWLTQHGDLKIITLSPNNLLAPTDYSVYVVNGEMVSNHRLKEMIHEDHNH